METDVDEIADGIYRFSTFVPDVGPTGFTFNQFLVDDDEPLLFHTGQRGMFPLVSAAIATVMPRRAAAVDHVRPPRGRRVRRDEPVPRRRAERPGRARRARVHGVAQRPRRPPAARRSAPTRSIDLGGKRVRNIDTPHVPHGWDAHVLYEETTGTLFCGDLFTSSATGPRSRATTSSSRGAGGGHVPRDVPHAADRAHDPALAELQPTHARDHARLVVRAATARRRCWRWPTTTTGGWRRPGRDHRRRRARPLGARRDRPHGHVLRRRVAARPRSRAG